MNENEQQHSSFRERLIQKNAVRKISKMTQEEKDELRLSIRRQLFKKNIPNYANLTGLEIGALCSPLLTKEESDVKYYDIFSKDTLIEHFQECYPGKTFVDVDFVAKTRSLSAVLGDNKFDYFIANHVVEHIPDFIGFFKAVSESLNEGGKFFLAIPDRRFTFDHDRPETSAGHLIVDHEDNGSVDAAEHILDALIYHQDHLKMNVYWSDIESGRYNFVHHHHVFNYETFLDRIIKPLVRMRYFPFSVLDYHYELGLDNEFIIVLEKCTDPEKIHVLGDKIPIQPLKDMSGQNLYDFREQMAMIAKSGWFDPLWYLSKYSIVRISGLNPLKHYYFWGAYHGFNPCDHFDSKYYLDSNPDVRKVGLNPLWHFLHNGKQEGRMPLPPDRMRELEEAEKKAEEELREKTERQTEARLAAMAKKALEVAQGKAEAEARSEVEEEDRAKAEGKAKADAVTKEAPAAEARANDVNKADAKANDVKKAEAKAGDKAQS